MAEDKNIDSDDFFTKEKETLDDSKSNSLTEVLSILYVTIVLIALFLKIMYG